MQLGKATAVKLGSKPATAVYLGSTRVWPTIPGLVVIGEEADARLLISQALAQHGLSPALVVELPFEVDTSQATDLSRMFNDCRKLVTVPKMNTANVSSMERMFEGCRSLTDVPDLNTANVTNAERMFMGCESLRDGHVRCIGKNKDVATFRMIEGSALTREPFYSSSGTPL